MIGIVYLARERTPQKKLVCLRANWLASIVEKRLLQSILMELDILQCISKFPHCLPLKGIYITEERLISVYPYAVNGDLMHF